MAAEERAARWVSALLRPLPRRAALSLGRGVGRVLGDLDRKHLAIAADNLRQAFPQWTERRILTTARGVYAHFGAVLFDILWLERRSDRRLLDCVEVEGAEHVQAALAMGKGMVLVTGHLGNWEVHGVATGMLFGPLGVVARPLDNPALDGRLCAFRASRGNTIIYKKRALNQVLRTLREGRGVAILVDQNVQEQDGIFVDFFSRKAATTTVAAALALKTGCALIPARTVLRPDGLYRAVYEPPIPVAPTGDREADIAALTQALTSRIEAWVREAPEQWLWIHRRWKTQPR